MFFANGVASFKWHFSRYAGFLVTLCATFSRILGKMKLSDWTWEGACLCDRLFDNVRKKDSRCAFLEEKRICHHCESAHSLFSLPFSISSFCGHSPSQGKALCTVQYSPHRCHSYVLECSLIESSLCRKPFFLRQFCLDLRLYVGELKENCTSGRPHSENPTYMPLLPDCDGFEWNVVKKVGCHRWRWGHWCHAFHNLLRFRYLSGWTSLSEIWELLILRTIKYWKR